MCLGKLFPLLADLRGQIFCSCKDAWMSQRSIDLFRRFTTKQGNLLSNDELNRHVFFVCIK
jgi:hypothetical protein